MTSSRVQLKENEIKLLKEQIKKGERKAREVYRANILLLANKCEKDKKIAETLSIHRHTVWRIKKRYKEEGIESALKDKPRSGQPKKYKIKQEAEIAAVACTDPPGGRKRWTLELLQEELRKKEGFETINRESIRLILKKTTQSHGKKECGASRK